jgi:hypothetical protein
LGVVALFAPFAVILGDAVVKGKHCEAERARLQDDVASLEKELAGVTPEFIEVEVEVPTIAPAESEPEEATPEGLPLGAFAFVRDGRLVLDPDADPRLAYGAVTGEVDFDLESVHGERKVFPGVEASLEQAMASTFVLYSDEGEVCRAKLTDSRLEATIYGDFFALVDYDTNSVLEDMLDGGALEDAQRGKKTQRRRWMEQLLRERVMDEASNWLTAEIEPISGDCEDAMWGRAESFDAPVIFKRDSTGDGAEEVRERFRGTKAHAEARKSFDEEWAPAEPGATWPSHEAESLGVSRWKAPSWQTVELAEVGYVGTCGEPDTYASALWVGEQLIAGAPGAADMVVGLDGETYVVKFDGGYDENMRLTRLGEAAETVMRLSVEFYGCSC